MNIQHPSDQVQDSNNNPAPNSIDLTQRFPKMKLIHSAPLLFTLNGFGLGVYGNRNADALTGTYVKTRCLCALFIPILPLDAYRVANAENGGWYFIGKEKLGGFASFWQKGAIGCLLFFVGSLMWQGHINSPEYRAEQANKQAEKLVKEGRVLEAADVYQGMIKDGLAASVPTSLAISELIRKEISSGDPARCVAALRYVDKQKVSRSGRRVVLPDLADLAITAAAKSDDPAVAESILSAFTPEPDELVRVHEARRPVLEKLHLLQPDAIHVRINLALIREEFGNLDGALELLEPAAAELGSGEGARLYGHLLLEAGRIEEALPHIERYVTPRVNALKTAESQISQGYERVRNKALDELNRTGGPAGFIQKYEAANENDQIQMVEVFVAEWIDKDTSFQAIQKNYQKAVAVLPSIMELGIAHLRLAQAETDSAKRSESLKKSETAFLMMSGSAGDTDEYRFFLGQVYFWSDREEKGRELFNQLLDSNQRSSASLVNLASVYRELGEEKDARMLLEEAFDKATTADEKTGIVLTRSLLARTSDEKIEWLSKGNASNPNLTISLAQARAEKAEQDGKAADAARYYREALAGYDKLGRSSTVLNNSAIICHALYRVEGKMEDFENAARLMSDALEMQPANSILAYNSATTFMSLAILRIAKDRVDPKLLQYSLDLNSLRFLYQTQSEKTELVNQLVADPNFRKSISRYWEALLLAPKHTDCYSWGTQIFHFIDDKESLRRLHQKATEQDFDFSDQMDLYSKYIKGERDKEFSDALKGSLQRVDTLASSIKESKAVAMAQSYMADARLGGFRMAETTGVETWIKELKAALDEVPCSHLRSTYDTSLEIVALEKLGKNDSECLEIINANRRHLDSSDIFRILVRSKGDLGDRVRKHPSVIEARDAAMIVNQHFPNNVGIRTWLMLDGYKSEFDSAYAKLVKQDECERLTYEIQLEIQFESPSSMLSKFWMHCLDGNDAAAREMQTKLQAAGVKMPEMF